MLSQIAFIILKCTYLGWNFWNYNPSYFIIYILCRS